MHVNKTKQKNQNKRGNILFLKEKACILSKILFTHAHLIFRRQKNRMPHRIISSWYFQHPYLFNPENENVFETFFFLQQQKTKT